MKTTIMWSAKFNRIIECFRKKPGLFILFSLTIVIFVFYFTSESYLEYENFFPYKTYFPEDEIVNGYLVWNPKCHMPSENPIDKSIEKYVTKMKFQSCSSTPLLSSIVQETNGTFYLVINSTIAKTYKKFICCWSSIVRPEPQKPPKENWDSKISSSHCEDFENRVQLPLNAEIIMVLCRASEKSKKRKAKVLYENIHSIINPNKINTRQNNTEPINNLDNHKKMSILLLGVDSVSRLNFIRSLPRTEKYMRETGWFSLNGYNKMGDNTFPNLMAILTGQNSTTAYSICKPKQAYGLDNCPFLWHNYKKAGYVTAYGEDFGPWSTFNYLKVGFVQPPTDYYLRPYVLATEKFLESKSKFDVKYCTGPEPAVNRIFDYAGNFAKTFVDIPYFGFFWTNSVSHNDVNGISSMDKYFSDYFEKLERQGVFNNTMVIFLSDHGMRWGSIRNTFIGWYEERLPFIYVRLPQRYHEDSEIFQALKINEHRLTSPYDLYETLRDILIKSGGEANSSSGCPTCQTLFQPVPMRRSCNDAGVSSHWCTCTAFEPENPNSKISQQGVKTFLQYVESVVINYKNKNGKRLCAKLKLKKVHRVNRIIDLTNNNTSLNGSSQEYFYLIETSPGGALFETTVRVEANGSTSMTEEEVSRINSYAKDSKCLNHGNKKYCYCLD
ncbi:hypothetical protein PV328_008865 [Microctonus aethiopoides]|uniref:Uncharacterized protein n=1 Tax=Microctonus aethiopoides TaxID=144406 RepID=A0AA39FK58_9HYME|nr:hypothetical protein PV328_008865 [Microctonus aethiopoides]